MGTVFTCDTYSAQPRGTLRPARDGFHLCLLLALVAGCHDPAMKTPPSEAGITIDSPARPAHWVAYVGGYGGSISWYSVDHATGALAMLGSVQQAGASFLAFDPANEHVYAVDESNSRVVAYAIDQTTGALTKLDDQPSGGSGPAHLTVAGHQVIVANYGDGAVAVLPIAADGSLEAATQTVNAGSHAHEIVMHGSLAFVPCLGADYVAQYIWNGATLTPNSVPHMATAAGAGPRHLAFGPAGPYAYLVDETASTLEVLALDDNVGQLSQQQAISTLPAGFTGQNTGAELAVQWNHVYTSNRGADDLAVFSIGNAGQVSPVAHVASGGTTPRHFSFSPDAALLFVANQGSNSVVAFSIGSDRVPVATGQAITVTSPSFVGIAELP
jgi:6-phosphogluconolactonase